MTISPDNSVRKELKTLDKEWSSAMVKDHAETIGRFLSDDWIIIGPEGNVIDRARFLAAVHSGDLSHESMVSDDWRVRSYGDTAVVTAGARSKGKYKGRAFATNERSTSVFIRSGGQWQCVLTHLTPITRESQ
jgi:ketosteroid isomerase-like protein